MACGKCQRAVKRRVASVFEGSVKTCGKCQRAVWRRVASVRGRCEDVWQV